MKMELYVKPLSINAAFHGRHVKTRKCREYDALLNMVLLGQKKLKYEYYKIKYMFYLKNFGNTDADNLVKVLQDAIVRRGIISDDRRVIDYEIGKRRADSDKIVIEISEAVL